MPCDPSSQLWWVGGPESKQHGVSLSLCSTVYKPPQLRQWVGLTAHQAAARHQLHCKHQPVGLTPRTGPCCGSRTQHQAREVEVSSSNRGRGHSSQRQVLSQDPSAQSKLLPPPCVHPAWCGGSCWVVHQALELMQIWGRKVRGLQPPAFSYPHTAAAISKSEVGKRENGDRKVAPQHNTEVSTNQSNSGVPFACLTALMSPEYIGQRRVPV